MYNKHDPEPLIVAQKNRDTLDDGEELVGMERHQQFRFSKYVGIFLIVFGGILASRILFPVPTKAILGIIALLLLIVSIAAGIPFLMLWGEQRHSKKNKAITGD